MTLYQRTGVSVESWVDMTADVPMRYEADPHNGSATLFFGQKDDYVLVLNRDNLAQVIALGGMAIAELGAETDMDHSRHA